MFTPAFSGVVTACVNHVKYQYVHFREPGAQKSLIQTKCLERAFFIMVILKS